MPQTVHVLPVDDLIEHEDVGDDCVVWSGDRACVRR
ncbi:hypothetical protein SEA_SQUEE_66 [Mycobacterium phage Squee]